MWGEESSSDQSFSSSLDSNVTHSFSQAYPVEYDDAPGANDRVLLEPQSSRDKGRLTVVLDMDETLIHSEFIDPAFAEFYQQKKETSDAFLEGVEEDKGVAVSTRPYLEEFLAAMGEHFEPIVFTAANSDYASAVIDWIDPCNHIRARLYRDSTSECKGASFVKDLQRLGRDMRRVVLVDNNLLSFLASPDNGLPCLDYYDDKQDEELKVILASLMELKDMKDVRPYLRRAFNLRDRLRQHNSSYVFTDSEGEDSDLDADGGDGNNTSMESASLEKFLQHNYGVSNNNTPIKPERDDMAFSAALTPPSSESHHYKMPPRSLNLKNNDPVPYPHPAAMTDDEYTAILAATEADMS